MVPTTPKTLKVLFHLHPCLDTLDFTGPFELLSHATYSSPAPPQTPVFEHTVTAVTEQVTSGQNCIFQRHIPVEEAHSRLAEFDVLVVPGGGSGGVLEANSEPLSLIRAWCALDKAEGKTRTLLSVCTGSLFLAEVGALKGLTATTHPDYYTKLRDMVGDQTTVVEERYVINKVNDNGLRVITSGGVTCGLDSCIWLINEVAGKEAGERVLHNVQYTCRQGVVV